MSIEKSIIRKAINGSAEEMAHKDSLEKPEQRHYDYVLNLYKRIRNERPEEIEKVILHSAEGKELKDKIGMDLYKVFDQIWKEKTKGFINEMFKRAGEVKSEKELTHEEFVKEMDAFAEKYLKEKGVQLRTDPQIVSAFSGKEEILNNVIDYGISTSIYIIKNF